jgi:hypothetical protein
MAYENAPMNPLGEQILRLLMDGMLELDDVKPDAYLHDAELARRLDAPVEAVREELAGLEVMGYVTSAQSWGGDPTEAYKGIDEHPADRAIHTELYDAQPTYYVSESGKRLVLTTMSDSGSTEDATATGE